MTKKNFKLSSNLRLSPCLSGLSVVIFLLSTVLFRSMANASAVELPTDELATEVVLPKVDRPQSVLNRNIVTDNKFELNLGYGWNFTEPIYEPGGLNLGAGYHWSEESALLLQYTQWGSGRNKTYTDPLGAGNKQLDFTRAPDIQNSIFGIYEWKAYYGKISLSKLAVANVHLTPLVGLGLTKYEHKSYYGGLVGAGWKLYFARSFGFKMGLKFLYSQAPSPFLGGGQLNRTNPVRPEPSAFKDKWGFDTHLDFALFLLL